MTDQKTCGLTEATTLLSTDLLYAVASSNSRKITVANAAKQVTVLTTRGDIARGDSAGNAERLALGTSNFVLASDGTDVVYRGGMTLSTASFSIVAADHLKTFRCSTAQTITLPLKSAVGTGFTVTLVNVDESVKTINTSGPDTIRGRWAAGQASIVLYGKGDHVTLVVGASWEITSINVNYAETLTTTSGATQEFLNIPVGMGKVVIAVRELSLSGVDELLVQLGDSGGFEATAYVAQVQQGTTTASSTSGFIVTQSGAAADSYNGIITLRRVNGQDWVYASIIGDGTNVQVGAGRKTTTGDLDRVRLAATGADTFDAGEASVFASYSDPI